MKKLAHEIWIFDGDPVQFLGLPYTTRMTIVRLSDGGLWVHSPIKLSNSITAGARKSSASNSLRHSSSAVGNVVGVPRCGVTKAVINWHK